MYADNPVESLARAVYSSIPRFSKLKRMIGNREFQSPLSVSDLYISHFQYLWGSTALGFGGIGGSAMTEAYTTVLITRDKKEAAVCFGGEFAYFVEDPNDDFFNDLNNYTMKSVSNSHEYGRVETYLDEGETYE